MMTGPGETRRQVRISSDLTSPSVKARAPPLFCHGCKKLSQHSALNQTKKGGFFHNTGLITGGDPPIGGKL